VKVAIFILTLVGCMSPHLLDAQTTGDCMACADAAACDTKHALCIAECRARYFSIDPKRSECLTECAKTSVKCTPIRGADCRSRNSCR
jgi:hypothetical protein